MAVRAVVAIGEEFIQQSGVLSDAGVARDEISALHASTEPLVLWVTAAGGTRKERLLVAGDWLCDSDGSEPRRIPAPLWEYDAAAKSWSRRLTLLSAWESCTESRWLLNMAHGLGVDPRPLALAACACARIALRFVPAGEDRPRRAIEVTEAWARGETTMRRVRAATRTSGDAQRTMLTAASIQDPDRQVMRDRYAAHGAALAATYASNVATSPDADFATAALTAAVSTVATVFASPDATADQIERRLFREMVATVRGQIPTVAVLRAAAAGNGPSNRYR